LRGRVPVLWQRVMNERFTILLAGELTVTGRLRQQIAGSRVIAADGGMAHAAELGVSPELWLGDFDSSDAALMARYAEVPRQTHPPAKDTTDGELAIQEAVARGAGEIVLAGGLGGQMDHAFAHLMLLLKAHARGLKVMLTSGHEEAWPVVDDALELDIDAGTRLSVLPVTDLIGLSIAGVRWPLAARDVVLGSTLTLSNEVTSAPVRVATVRGMAVVLVYPPG
jgi:thiamine pyrophosphokinase